MKNFSARLWMIYMLLCCFTVMLAQNDPGSNIRIEARQFFSEKEYTKALPLYRELLNSFPKEPEYQYCTGVCLIQNRGDLDEAIRLLRATETGDYSPLSLYYLGRAQHLNYSFDDAIKAYSRFLVKAKKEDIQAYNVERLIEMARNGLEYTRAGNSLKAEASQSVLLDQLQPVAEIIGSGKLMKKPVEFCSKTDIRYNYRPWMFLPVFTEINEYVYVAGYEIGKKNNSQLFRIKNINHTTWGFPEPLNQGINTPYDEEYPYFDSKTSTLYFSTTGHSSMGGYDIFRSVYDWNTKSWSKPENMGFPINSPYDDFIFIPDELNQSASFVSTRNSGPNKANIYRIKLEKNSEIIRFQGPDEIRKASLFQIVSPIPEVVLVPDSEPVMSSPDSIKTVISATPPDPPGDYNKVLAEALLLQVKADSVARITRDLRILAKENPDENQKKQLISEMIKYDKESKNLQREADLKFAEARKMKSYETSASPVRDSILILSKEINGISVYQYKADIPDITYRDPAAVVEEETPLTVQAAPEKASPVDELLIGDKPAYDNANPIPMLKGSIPGLVYRVQLGVFSNARANDAFGGISPVTYENVPGKAILKYYAGVFYSHNAAVKALEAIRAKGFPDVFIVAFLDGKLITTEKAREIEFSDYKL